MSLKKQLDRYKKHLKSAQTSESKPAAKEKNDRYEQELMLAAEELEAEVCHFDEQFVLIRTEQYSADQFQGDTAFSELFDVMKGWDNREEDHPLSSKGLSEEDLLFFDTETTGLGAGSGHMIFLIGWARVSETSVTLKQYFLPGPGHEAAFYHYFLKDCQDLKNLVTYNGKAFDWPRVKTRHQFVKKQVPALPLFGHFDLLHASRRLWKHSLINTRLETIEKEILNMPREMDIPGHMAPFLYFQFLKRPNAALVRGVMEHNKEDVKSLISLYVQLSKRVLGQKPVSAAEQFELARWNHALGQTELAVRQLEELSEVENWSYKTMIELAPIYKKQKNKNKALKAYHQLVETVPVPKPEHLIELAKFYEHEYQNYEKALSYTEEALLITDKKPGLFKNRQQMNQENLQKRKVRLLRKLSRNK